MTEPSTIPATAVSPLTGGNAVRKIRTLHAEELVEAWRVAFDIDIASELEDLSTIELFECLETRLQFFHPPEAAGSIHLYDQLQNKLDWYYDYRNKPGGGSEVRWEFARAIEQLSDCRQVVDVGAGRGAFVELARDRGLKVRGIDTSPEAVRSARSRDLPVEEASIRELVAREAGRFDGICSFQTLEHLANPRDFLEQIVDLAEPGARIVLAVPNVDCYQARLPDRDRLLDMPPHHMLRWSQQAFESLPRLFPLRLEVLETEPLASYNVNAYVRAKLSNSMLVQRGAFAARYGAALFRLCLRLGARRLCRGVNLYAGFRKV